MTFQSIPEAIPIGIAAVLSCALAIFAWRRRAMPMAPAFVTMMAGETAWALGATLEPILVDLSAKRICIDLRILGTVTAILGLLAFVLRYTGLFRWLTIRRFAAICAPAIPLIALAWTDPLHHLYWTQLSNQRIGDSWIAVRSFGPGFWALLSYCYAMVAVSALLLLQAAMRSGGVYRAQAAVMLFGVLFPWIVEISDMTRMIPFIPVDLVSPTFAITGLTFLPALLRFRLLDLPPIAWAVVVTGMEDPVVVIDPQCRLVELNPAAQRLAGRTSDELAGESVSQAFADWPDLTARLCRFEPRQESFELAGPARAPTSWFDVRISPLGDDARPCGWVLVLREITEFKRAEEERVRMHREQAARAHAEAANRAKERFFATLSHELRTPLTPILAVVTAMLDDAETPEPLRPVLEMFRRNISLEARLIDDLLDLTRIRTGQFYLERELIDAHALIHHVVEICREDLRAARLCVDLELGARKHDLFADPARFQQVLWNLLKNAIKFSAKGGVVTIRSRDSHGNEQGAGGARLILEISDTGVGIEPELLPRIFDVFEQEAPRPHRGSGGLGLGLLISRSILEQHGGTLAASSGGKDLGATFTVDVPAVVTPPDRDESRDALSHGAIVPHRPLTILLVEDNTDTLNYLSKVLTSKGNSVHTASSLDRALRVAREVDFDVLVSDIELPDGTGLELIGTLRSSRAVSGIALSGFGSTADIEQSKSAGFAEHLTKPVDFKRLEKAIQQAAARGREAAELTN